jgi:hypothetical protein
MASSTFGNKNDTINMLKIISTQKLKLLYKVLGYNLYYFLTHLLSKSPLNLKLAQTHITLYLIFIK